MRTDTINTIAAGSTVWIEGSSGEYYERHTVTKIRKLVISTVNERGEKSSFLRTDGIERGSKSRWRRRRIAIDLGDDGKHRLLTDKDVEEQRRLRQLRNSTSKLRELIAQRSLRIPLTDDNHKLLAAITAILHRDAHDGAWQIDVALSPSEDEADARAMALQAIIKAAESLR